MTFFQSQRLRKIAEEDLNVSEKDKINQLFEKRPEIPTGANSFD